jgi:Spy/CpxP family protein refolding chaperone
MKTCLRVLLLCLLSIAGAVHGAGQTGADNKPAPPAKTAGAGQAESKQDAPKYPLSEDQKRAVMAIVGESRRKGAPLAARAAKGAKEFDENVLSEKPDAEADLKAQQEITDALTVVAVLRLQTIRDVVAVLTPEQKRLLKDEMAKPGAPSALLEALARVFKLPEQ